MAYVPGYENDIFVSYAHGDDRDWIGHLTERLKGELKRRLGAEPTLWIDNEALPKSRDFRDQIPASVEDSALFVLFASPSYLRSEYSVGHECRAFEATLPIRRTRFSGTEFTYSQFALRCLLVPIDNNEHWELFPGLTDISFCDGAGTFPLGSHEFETALRQLVAELILLLKRMRNRSTPVFVYPYNPDPPLAEAHELLCQELTAQSYRLLPDRLVGLPAQLNEAALAVFLLGERYDDTLDQLTTAARRSGKPWLVWCLPMSEDGSPEQAGFIRTLEDAGSDSLTFLNASKDLREVKGQVLSLLRPNTLALPLLSEKPRVYVVYDSRDRREKANAGRIVYHYRKEFQFQLNDEPAMHTERMAESEGVLLVWGSSEEAWCLSEFETMLQISGKARSRGLCLFEPRETKISAKHQLHDGSAGVHLIEQFGPFDAGRLEAFFGPIRQGRRTGAL
ncbi:MAG TPA: toll/interleukin-1 receptor domain-containing protein [Candidatus Sulfotelmatobacter sp.]|jgi:hypothetical protein|nr:toll/interleukin-1 receptor domain-containing protein [Candidatus Sulfotelmatobacter sp.]